MPVGFRLLSLLIIIAGISQTIIYAGGFSANARMFIIITHLTASTVFIP